MQFKLQYWKKGIWFPIPMPENIKLEEFINILVLCKHSSNFRITYSVESYDRPLNYINCCFLHEFKKNK